MLKLDLTDQAIKAIAQNKTMNMEFFIAGSSRTLSHMQEWLDTYESQSGYTGPYDYTKYAIVSAETYIVGDTYPRNPKPGEKTVTVTENFLEVIGSLNCTLVDRSFSMRSLAVTATVTGTSEVFIYAFGAQSLSDKPYPINVSEAITYTTPVKIIYSSLSDISPQEAGVPWKNFIQHTEESVTSENGAHGLKINPVTKELTVGDTTVILSGGDERIAELEEEVQGILKYSQREDGRKYVSEWAVSTPEGDGSSTNPYKITNPYHLTLVGSLGSGSVYYSLEANLDLGPCTVGARATWSISGNTVTFQNVDTSAPCYNKGMGFPCLRLANGSVFNGNNHFIKNLIIGSSIDNEIGVAGGVYETVPYGLSKNSYIEYRTSLFCEITGSSVSNSKLVGLNLVSSVIVLGFTSSRSNMKVSSFCNHLNYGIIENCSSDADIILTQSNQYAGGICGRGEGISKINFCSFRGTLSGVTNESSSYVGYIVGSFGLSASEAYIKGCYSTSSIDFGFYRTLAGEAWGKLDTCWFAGYIQPHSSSDIDNIGTLMRQNSGYNLLIIQGFTENSFSLEGSCVPQRTQGTVLSREYMQSEDFVNDLNLQIAADSENPIFVYKPGDFPRLWFEEDEKPLNAQIAAINTENRKVLDSGYTVQTLANVPTVQDLAGTYRRLSTAANSKSRVTGEEVTVPLSSWSSNRYRYYTSSVGLNQSLENIILVPESSDFFNYGIYANQVVYDNSHDPYWYIEFICTTLPSSDISFRIIVIEGGIVT